MRFDIYGRFQLEVRREHDAWQAYRLAGGKRVPEEGLVIPADVGVHELAVYLDDIYHEYAGPGETVELLA